jgi:hypothetical protein
MDGDCICGAGATNGKGYSTIFIGGKNELAHRFTYRLFVGEIPDGLVIDHTCRNRRCIEPSHLRAVTHQENILCGTGATATNAKKTHCKNGHEFTEENTYRCRLGRGCRTCRKEKRRIYYLRFSK